MKKFLIHFLMIICTVTFLGLNLGITSHAYTEEEKQQAKAWLSAHGYSPDAGGASQAYQDYLDGKFDEELGINTTENSTEDTTTEASSQTNQSSTTENASGDNTSSTTEKSSDTSSTEQSFWGIGSTDYGTEISEENVTTEEPTTVETTENEAEATAETFGEADTASQKNGEITLYQQQKMDTYKDALMVILLAVLLTAVTEGFILLL